MEDDHLTAPRFVLIHGGGTTARFWDRVVDELPAPTLAVNLPGRADRPADLERLTVDDEVASVVADIAAATFDGPAVLVAHSSGGLVVPGVLELLGPGAVSHVVLNAASVPPPGGTGMDCMQERHRGGILAAREAGLPLLTPGPPADPETFRKSYGTLLTDDDLAFVVDPVRCVVDTMNHYFQPVDWSAAPSVPVTYVVNLRDRPVPVELQRTMAVRLPMAPEIVEIDGGHIPAIVEPQAFAQLLTDRA